MTTHRTDPELLNTVLQLLTDQGATGGLAEGIRLLVNEAMRLERSQALQAQPYERTKARQGHANGFKPKTLATRVGSIQFRVPQVRGGLDFYPSALEKGVRSEQALIGQRQLFLPSATIRTHHFTGLSFHCLFLFCCSSVTLCTSPFGGAESLAPLGAKDVAEPKGLVGAPG